MRQGHSKKRAIQLMSSQMSREGNRKHKSSRPKFSDRQPTSTKPQFKKHFPIRIIFLVGLLALNVYAIMKGMLVVILLVPFTIIYVLIYAWGWTRTCPRCDRFWARKLIDRSYFGTRTGFEETTNRATFRNPQGQVIGTSSTQGIKPVNLTTIQNYWTCKYCGHSWSGGVHDVRS